MRTKDKLKHIKNANLLAEQRYLETKMPIISCHGNLEEVSLVNKPDNDTYFDTLAAALDHVRGMAAQLGYEVDDNEMFNAFGTGGVSYGQTKKGLIPLLKNGQPILSKSGQPINRAISVTIYRMDSGKYELTAYKTF